MTNSAKDGTVDGAGGDDDEWADDDNARTVAQSSPDFELPPGVPLPISMPPTAGPSPAPAPVVPKAAPLPASAPKMPVAARAPASSPMAARAPAPGPMPPRAPTPGPMPPRAPAPGPMPPRAGGAMPPRAPAPGPMPPRAPSPSAPRVPVAPPPAARAPVAEVEPDDIEEDEHDASTSVLAPEEGAPLLAKMDELGRAPPDDDDADNDGPTMAGAPGLLEQLMGGPPPIAPAPDAAPVPKPPAHRADVFAPLNGPADPEDESTRAVPRDELLRAHDAKLVVGDDAVGDEATLAVPPEKLESALGGVPKAPGDSPLGAALAATLAGTADGPSLPAFPPPPAASTAAYPQPASPPGGPFGAPLQQPPLQQPPMQQPLAPPPAWPDSGNFAAGPGSNPNPMQATAPHQNPSGPYALGPHQAPISRPGVVPTNPALNAPWPAPANAPVDPRARTQLILLVVVGIVCVSIFGIGIYLFVSTMNEAPKAPAPLFPTASASAPAAPSAHRR